MAQSAVLSIVAKIGRSRCLAEPGVGRADRSVNRAKPNNSGSEAAHADEKAALRDKRERRGGARILHDAHVAPRSLDASAADGAAFSHEAQP